MKISIIGMGHVGATVAHTLMLKGLCKEMILFNRNMNKAKGDALDLSQALSFVNHTLTINSGEVKDTAQSDVIIICISAPWQKHYTSRFDFTAPNIAIFSAIIPDLMALSPNAKLILVSNPVDILTYFCVKHLHIPKAQVLGIGTLIDSARLRKGLSNYLNVHPDDIRAYVLGEHGNSQFAVWSKAFVGGKRIKQSINLQSLVDDSVQTGYNLMAWKGYSNFAIAMAVALVVESIYEDNKRTIPISTLVENYYGIGNVCFSIPVVIGKNGIEQTILPELTLEEEALLHHSASILVKVLQQYEL